jgi:hypothetical protein
MLGMRFTGPRHAGMMPAEGYGLYDDGFDCGERRSQP